MRFISILVISVPLLDPTRTGSRNPTTVKLYVSVTVKILMMTQTDQIIQNVLSTVIIYELAFVFICMFLIIILSVP